MKYSASFSIVATAVLLALQGCQSFIAFPHASNRLSSQLQMVASVKKPGTAKLDTPWTELGFEFRPTNSHIRLTHKDGAWGKPELVKVCPCQCHEFLFNFSTLNNLPCQCHEFLFNFSTLNLTDVKIDGCLHLNY